MYIKFRLLGIGLFLSLTCFAQKGDSLKAVLDTAKNQYRVKALNESFRLYITSEPVKAVGFAREALSYATEVNDRKGLAAAYNNLGVAYRTQGAMDKALEYYINALRIYEELGNKEGIATTKNNISTIYSIKKDFSASLKYLEDSYKMFTEMEDREKMIGSLNNLGNLHSEMQMYEKALEYYTEAFNLSEKDGKLFGDALNNIGNLHFKQKNYQRAVEYYDRALAAERAANNKGAVLNALTNLAVTFTKAKQPAKAQSYLDEALALCNEIQAFSFLPSLYRSQAENYALQNKWKEAYEVQVKYDEAREAVYGEESTRNIAQMELRLSFQEKEKELDFLRKDDEIKTLELRNTRLIIILALLAVLVTLGILNYVFLSKKKIIKKRSSVKG